MILALCLFFLAVASDQFQALALGWISALSAIVIAFGYAAAKIWPVVVDLKARFDALNERVNRHGERLTSQDATIAQVALATPPPTPPAAQPPQS